MENEKSNAMLIDAISLTICKNEEVPTGPDDDEYMDYMTGQIFLMTLLLLVMTNRVW